MLKINNLSNSLSKKTVLNEISLNIENNNQVIALLGPNGAGKTSLLKTIAGFYQKYTGSVNINKDDVFLLPDFEFIPKEMSIKNCIEDFKILYKNFNSTRLFQMLTYLKIDKNKKISEYSKGMKEQVHLVFALSQDVKLYLFDEPLAAVDPLTRDTMIHLIENFRNPNSVAIISTHIVSDMERLFDEVIMINEGKVLLYDNTSGLVREKNKPLDQIFKEVMANASTF